MKKRGNDFRLKVKLKGASAFTVLGGLQSISLSVGKTEIEVTNMGTSQWKTLLSGAGVSSVTLSGSGVFNTSSTLTQISSDVLSGTLREFQVEDADSGQLWTGFFQVTSWERTGEHDGMQSYSVSLASSGAITVS